MPKVYVVQDNGRFNLIAAQKYGELVPLLPAMLQLQLSAEEAITTISEKLLNYTDEDCLLAIGDPAAIGIAMCIATFYNGGIISLLKFDRQQNDYYKLPINLSSFFESPAIDTTAGANDVGT